MVVEMAIKILDGHQSRISIAISTLKDAYLCLP